MISNFDCKSAAGWQKCADMNGVMEGSLRGSKGQGTTNPVFVVGVLRSGTSLLYSLLNQHPQMSFMYECDAWNFPQLLSGPRFRGNWLERQEFYNQALSRHRLIFGNSLRGLENVRSPDDLYEAYSQGKDAVLWGEKSPLYCCRLQQLFARSPRSPFVLIWRDPLEVYRSVLQAGHTSRFFRRPGMLNRVIIYHESMVAQAAAMEKAGARVHHVTYAELIDNTAKVCEGICEFLGVPFDEQMLNLKAADLSPVYKAAQHEHLRRGVIQRQQFSDAVVAPKIVAKLGRFRNRWSRLNPVGYPPKEAAGETGEPSFFEQLRHRAAGNLLCTWDSTKRVLFEFLPLEWLRTYRETVQWFLSARHELAEPKKSWREQIAAHWVTMVVCYLMIAVLGVLDSVNPHLSLLPFYMMPCAFLALTINWRWGTVAALITACIGPALLRQVEESFAQVEVVLWNSCMRFLLLEFGVVVLDRIRREFAFRKKENV
jgi:hypothetical protein